MSRLTLIALYAGLCLSLLSTGCRRQSHRAVSILGSTSIQPFAEMVSEEFNKKHPENYVEIQGGGSTAGLQAVLNGISEIGMCSRGLKESEAEVFDPIRIALDGMAVVVNAGNPVSDLSVDQIRQMFNGSITNWNQFGGPDGVVHLITREEGSGTREAFQKLVMGKDRISRRAVTQESNGAVKELVRHDPWSIGYMSMGLVADHGSMAKPLLKSLSIAGVDATSENVVCETYQLVRPFLFVKAKGAELSSGAALFVKFIRSPEGRSMLEREGLVAPE